MNASPLMTYYCLLRNFSDANIASRLVPARFAVAATREVLKISLLHQPVNVREPPQVVRHCLLLASSVNEFIS